MFTVGRSFLHDANNHLVGNVDANVVQHLSYLALVEFAIVIGVDHVECIAQLALINLHVLRLGRFLCLVVVHGYDEATRKVNKQNIRQWTSLGVVRLHQLSSCL